MSLPLIRAALETRLNAIAPPIATAWSNDSYVPVNGIPYQQVFLLLAAPSNPEMGAGYREQGYMQVTLKYALGVGPGAAEQRAKLIRDQFPKNLSLSNGGIIVTIERTPEISGGAPDVDQRWSVFVKVRFYSNMMM